MSAVISACGTFRYTLEREVQLAGIVFAYFGVNGSTADGQHDDQTVSKWTGFTKLNGGRRFIVGNAFAYRSKEVRALARAVDPVGPDNDAYLRAIIDKADVLVPCWGPRTKVPAQLRYRYDVLEAMLFASGKPVMCFGLSKSGDPLHPLMLAYATPLIPYPGARQASNDARASAPALAVATRQARPAVS